MNAAPAPGRRRALDLGRGLGLASGERIVWCGRRGHRGESEEELGCRRAGLVTVLGFCVVSLTVPLLAVRGTRAVFWVPLVIAGACVAVVRLLRLRPQLFFTDRRLVSRSLLGGVTSVPLARVRSFHRPILRVMTRHGERDVLTSYARLDLDDGAVCDFGPVLEYEEFTDLLRAVLGRTVDPAALRGLDGTPAPAEARDDLFVALDNRTDGEAYGPVVVLPHGVVRFTSQLAPAFEGELCTLLASAEPPEAIEARIVALARHGRAGHALVVSRNDVRLSVADTVLVLKLAAREEHVELDPPAAERARRYLRRSEPSAAPNQITTRDPETDKQGRKGE